MNNHTILAVNDNADQFELLAFILGEAGYRILRAENGFRGLEIARRESPDLIISDVKMPEMDGVELCRQIRADRQLRSIPFLLVSALSKDTESVVEGLEAGADDYFEAPYEPIRLAAKAAQLIERKRTDDALRASEERYRNFIEQSTEGIWRIEFKVRISANISIDEMVELAGQHGYYAECNDAMAQMYGFATAHDLTGKYCKELVNFSESDNRKFLAAFIENGFRLSDGESHEFDAEGNDKYFLNNFVGIVENSRLVSVWGIQRDITESKLAEQVLRTSQIRLEKQNAVLNELTKRRRLFHVPVQDAVREITEIAAAALEIARVSVWLYGDDKSKIKALDVYDLNQNSHSNDAELWQSDYPNYFAALAHDEVIICNNAQIDPITCEFTESYLKLLGITSMLDVPIRFGGDVVGVLCCEHVGKIREWKLDEQNFAASMAGLIALLLEASGRQQTEIALRESQEYLEIAQQAASVGSFEFDIKTRRITSSVSMEILYGVQPGSLSGDVENWSKYVHPEDLPRIKQELKEITSGVEYKSEFRILLDNGSIRWIVSKGRIFYDGDAKPARLVGVNIDITDRKQNELNLSFQKSLLAAQSEASIDGILVVSPTGEIISYNQRFIEMWRIPTDVQATKSDEAFIKSVLDKLVEPEEFLDTVDHLYENPAIKNQVEILLKDGRTFERYSAPIMDDDETPFGRIWTFRDITERKQSEEIMRESEKRYRLLFEANPLPMWVYDVKTFRFLAVNAAAIFHYGYTREEFLSMTIKDIRPPEDIPALIEDLSQIKGGIDAADLWKHTKKNGDVIDVEITLHELVFSSRRANLVLAVDVTERKKAEESIRFQAHLLNTVEQSVIATDLKGTVVYWNRFAEKLYGWTTAEAVGRSVRELTTPDFCDKQSAEIMTVLGVGTSSTGEFVAQSKTGETFPGQLCVSPIHDDNGKLIGGVGVSTDITERKQADKIIKESEKRYRIVAESASDMIITINESSKILFVNPVVEKILGYKPEELIGNNLTVIIPERFRASHQAGIERYLQSGERQSAWSGVEVYALHREGREILIEISFGEYKENDNRLFTAVIRDITERKRVEEALRQAEARYRNLIELSPAIVYLMQPFPPYSTIYISPNIEVFGYSVEEWHYRDDMWRSLIHEEDCKRVLSATENAINQGLDIETEYRIVARNGDVFWVHDKGRLIFDEQGNKTGWQGVILDVTETKKLEEQLRQSQKLESVGKLAGGIAHDFNNMLTAINGYSDLTLRRLKSDDPLRGNIQEIKKAGERSAALTQQLLAFSRKQMLKPKVLNLNEVIIDTSKMLNRLIGEHIHLELVPDSNLGMIEADPGQLTQVIMNLAVNARDAMPHGGNLIIETSNVCVEEQYAQNNFPVQAGAYILVTVTDTGTGIDEDTKEHIFEPFYTTKNVGEGTGLGLATVYGIIKQSEGYIRVDSEVGKGTSFKIYLPRVDEVSDVTTENKSAKPTQTGTETILLVEDEDLVRNMSRQMLEAYGYRVFEASNGAEALSICESHFGAIDLLLTDVVMPQMSGRKLAEKVAETQPQIRLLYMSGYTDDTIIRQGNITEDKNFIQKPFTFEALANKLRELLN